MPITLTASTNDGHQSSGLQSSWDNAHDAVGHLAPDINDTRSLFNGMRYELVTGRGADQYYLTRSFFDFDTSGISIVPEVAIFNLKIYNSNDCTPCVVAQSGHDPSDATDDWFSTWITGQGVTLSGWIPSEIDAYSTGTAIGSVDAVTSFTLLSNARADMASLDTFKICVLAEDDYRDSAPTSGVLRTGVYWADHGTSTNRPNISYVEGTAAVRDNATFFGANF